MVQLYQLKQKLISIQSLRKDKSRLHQFCTEGASRIFIEYALNSAGGWTGRRLDHSGLARHRERRRVRGSCEKVQVRCSGNQEVCRKQFCVLVQMVP